MAALCRLAGRQMCTKWANHEKNILFMRAMAFKAEPFKQTALQGHDERNMKLGRPMSPHLTIYAFQVTSVLSISHRMTGCLLASYVTMFGVGSLLVGDFTTAINNVHMGAATHFIAKMLIAFPFSYHFVNGIRHMVWDMGKSLSIKDVYSSGYIMLAGATALTVGLASL